MSFLEKNLAAMQGWTPATARLIRAAAIPPGFESATGTDGTSTFRRVVVDPATGMRQLEWLGGTSMPAASAAALVKSFEPGTGNGLALSIGSGHEWAAFARKASSTQAVFVYEPEAALMRMALTICDLTAFLASGQMVLFSGAAGEAGEELAGFLAGHAGYEAPTVLHPLATIEQERRNALLAAGEAIVRRGVQARQQALNVLAGAFERAMAGGLQGAAALTVRQRYPGERPMRGAIAADVPELRLDAHDSVSLGRRLEFLIEHRPAKIVSDFFRPQLACIPPNMAVETWIPPLIGPAFWQPDRLPASVSLSPLDRIIVHAAAHRDLLQGHGIPVGQIELRALLPAAGHMRGTGDLGRDRIALIGDLPPIDIESLGLQLPTHQAIHAAAREFIAADYLAVSFSSAADLLRRALRRAGAEGAEESLREPMLRMIRDVLIPAVPLLTLARVLVDQKMPVCLIGDWPGMEAAEGGVCSVMSFAAFTGLEERWRRIAGVVHLSPWGVVSPLVLEAAASGVAIVVPRHPTDGWAGALPSVLQGEIVRRPEARQLFAVVASASRR